MPFLTDNDTTETSPDSETVFENDTAQSEICDAPTPWPVPTLSRVVGTGAAASCTQTALGDAVKAGAHVTFNCGDAPVVISVTEEIETADGTVLDGEGNAITLDGNGSNRILVAPGNTTLSVRNIAFVNGQAPMSEESDGIGGAIAGQWRSKVEVRNCTFKNNRAGRGGGAVAVWTGSALTVERSHFEENQSYYGGAIYSLLSPLTVTHSTFINNSTIDNGWGEGGAIGTDGASEDPDDAIGGNVEICGSVFQNNHGLRSGGGVYVWVYPPDVVTVEKSTIEANEIGGGGLGGGMRISNGQIEIRESIFLSNISDNHGGALYLDCEPECVITNTTFYNNQAETYGGAISSGSAVRINNVTFAANFAAGHGGALFGGDGFNLHNSIFLNNSAGNPWNQANNCSETVNGSYVLQWHSDSGDGGGDKCISDVTEANPLLTATPGEYGGPTETMPPMNDSPVLNAGSQCPLTDQRGTLRNKDTCDLGAVELP
ncbi:MAG: hypothetical protein JXR76_11075 [Deltaproteobacteria bacterium]|nr:hypothetical protein [Deltaproteobacteria bacterium]